MNCVFCVIKRNKIEHSPIHLVALTPSSQEAVSRCEACRTPVCDDHAYFDEGKMFCVGCVEFWANLMPAMAV